MDADWPNVKTPDDVQALLDKALSPSEIFGSAPEKALELLRKICHPDKNPGNTNAEELFKRVEALFDEFKKPPVVVQSPKRQYTIRKLLAAGDVSDIHLGTAPFGPDASTQSNYILKISRVPVGQLLLANEKRHVAALLTAAADSTYRRYFPILADSFPAKDAIQKRINVFVHEPGLFNLDQVRQQHPALGGRHLAWIFKRLLTAIGFVHRQGLVHGAVLPAHVMLHPEGHGLQLVGWGHSIPAGQTVATLSSRFKEWYPPEILGKQPATPASDIYMAAKCLIYLAGGDPVKETMPETVPQHMQRFLRSTLLPGSTMRPADAWALLEEFDDLLASLYGSPKFIKLVMK